MKQALLRVFVAGLVGIALLPLGAAAWNDPTLGEGLGEVAVQKEPRRLAGQIFIIGNEVTRQDIILEQVGLYPGERITLAKLAAAERRLAGLGLFNTDKGREPRVRMIADPLAAEGEQVIFDIRVDVAEKPVAVVASVLADGIDFIRAWNKAGFSTAVDEVGGVLGDLIKWLRGPKPARLAWAGARFKP